MLSKISWSEFIGFLVVIFIIYYLFTAVIFFKDELLIFSRAKKKNPSFKLASASLKSASSKSHDSGLKSEGPQDSFNLIYDFLEDLKKIFVYACESRMVKEELLQAIHSKIKEYPHVGDTDLKDDISQHITVEAKQYCNLDLDAEDLLRIWAV